MVEIDVRPCGDGTLVVVHDDSLQRVAGDQRRVSSLSVKEIKHIDVGNGERIPTLDEALSVLRGRALVNLDQKVDGLTESLLTSIDRAGARKETMLSGNAASTFAFFQAHAPEVRIALSIDARRSEAPLLVLEHCWSPAARSRAARIIHAARSRNLSAVTLDYHLAAPKVVQACKRAGLQVLTWTVDDLGTMRRLRQAGVDGITSNRPDLLMQLT